MNNQVKLIDADKVLEWAAEMKFEGRIIDYWGFSHEISAGKFDPDTSPAHTIKPGDKVRILDAMDPKYIGRVTTVVKTNLSSPFSARLKDPSGWWMFSSLEVVE